MQQTIIARTAQKTLTETEKTLKLTVNSEYPTIDIKDIPQVNAFLVNPDGKSPTGTFIPPSGAGEPSTRPTAAAIANAIFDATGVRVRRQPMNAQTVLAALRAAGKA